MAPDLTAAAAGPATATRRCRAGDREGGPRAMTPRPSRRGPASRRRGSRRATAIEEIEQELARIWARAQPRDVDADGHDEVDEGGRHIAARTSVMNLVVVARQPEVGERSAATIQPLTGRHPSRTTDRPAGRSGRAVLDRRPDPGPLRHAARRRAGDVRGADLPRRPAASRAATCAASSRRSSSTTCRSRSGGPASRRSAVAPGDDLLEMADRLVVDGSTWSGDGVDRAAPAGRRRRAASPIVDPRLRPRAAVALARGDRGRSSTIPEFLPYLRQPPPDRGHLRDATTRPALGTTNIVKPLYHVAWLASRLGHARRDAARRR